MNKETILKSDVLDIIFDNRNKAYGAYNLRKFYNNRLIKSLAVMLTGVVILSAFTFLPKKEKENEIFDNGGITTRPVNLPEEKPKEEKPKEQPKKEIKQQPVNQAKLLNKIVIVKNSIDTIKTIDDKTVIGSINVTIPTTGGPSNPPIVTPPNIGGGGDGGLAKPKPEPVVDLTKTYNDGEVDVMPSYPGGMDALRKFLERNLENPRDMEEGDAVSVKVKFVVGYDGKLQSFVTVQDGGDEFNREVMRVLKKMPNWVPGKAKGQNVSVFYTIPIKFIPAN
jgi:periplasmic protein TonB